MKPNSKRARRRNDSDRMKAKARRVAVVSWGARVDLGHTPEDVVDLKRIAQKHADHLATCSRPCCGNPRRHFHHRTRKEEIAAVAYRQQVEG